MRRAKTAALVDQIKRKIREGDKKGEDISDLKLQLKEAESLFAKYKEQMGDMQVSSRTIVGYWALPAGLDLHGSIVVLNPKDRDLDMLEYSLDCLSRAPVLGAHSARGCGEISGVFDVIDEGKKIGRAHV